MQLLKYGGPGQSLTPYSLTTGVPSGVLVGRASAGTGAAEFVTLPGSGSVCKYIISFSFIGGLMAASQILGYHAVAAPITIPANFGTVLGAKSQAGGDANTTASTVVTVKQATSGTGSFSSIGTITFAISSITPTFATAGGVAINVAQGSVIRVEGPVSPDATFSNFFCTLVGQ